MQEHIIHGDLKASNVLLKTCVPAMYTDSSNTCTQPAANNTTTPSMQQNNAVAGPFVGSWSVNGQRHALGSSDSSGSGSSGTSHRLPSSTAAAAAAPAAGSAAGTTVDHHQGSLSHQGLAAQASAGQGLAQVTGQGSGSASVAIMGAAAAVADERVSGMHSLLKCGWVVAKVSDFGLSMCVTPDETHVSSVHAVSGRAVLCCAVSRSKNSQQDGLLILALVSHLRCSCLLDTAHSSLVWVPRLSAQCSDHAYAPSMHGIVTECTSEQHVCARLAPVPTAPGHSHAHGA